MCLWLCVPFCVLKCVILFVCVFVVVCVCLCVGVPFCGCACVYVCLSVCVFYPPTCQFVCLWSAVSSPMCFFSLFTVCVHVSVCWSVCLSSLVHLSLLVVGRHGSCSDLPLGQGKGKISSLKARVSNVTAFFLVIHIFSCLRSTVVIHHTWGMSFVRLGMDLDTTVNSSWDCSHEAWLLLYLLL